MAKGLMVPMRVTPRGGADTIEDHATLHQTIALALIPAGSLNPWHQRLTPPEDIVFSMRDATNAGLIISHAEEFFAELERLGRAKLVPGSGLKIEDPGPGDESQNEMVLLVNYIDLEYGTQRELRLPITGGV